MKMNQLARTVAAIFAVLIGLYSLLYLIVNMRSHSLLQTKPAELLNSTVWSISFFIHIISGGLGLLIGWSQFNAKRRKQHLSLHQLLGRIYLVAVALSGISGLYVAFFATGGWISAFGFSALAMIWLFTDVMAYLTIHRMQIAQYRRWMMINYSLTFAAVTLRLWLPVLTGGLHFDFIQAYHIVSWLCWVPNLALAWWLSQPKAAVQHLQMA